MLEVRRVEKYYGSKNNVTKALDGVEFTVDKGAFIAIMGPSGSGKTTLLNCISTIDTPSAGNIFINGTDIAAMRQDALAKFRRENLGFIFQEFNLLDTLTIEENIGMALTINHAVPEEVQKQVRKVAGQLGIGGILSKFPYQVSGGQRQRCACARAMVCGQDLILADEPTGALDSKSAKDLMQLLGKMNKNHTATILMVTHDAVSASYADRILFLQDGRLQDELRKGDKSRREFYSEILDVLAFMGGDTEDAR